MNKRNIKIVMKIYIILILIFAIIPIKAHASVANQFSGTAITGDERR